MDTFNIKRFSILGFLNVYNVNIEFEGDTKILVGENGIGKTQILNILYYTLSRRFEKLLTYSFEKILIKYDTGGEIVISKPEMEADLFKDYHPVLEKVIKEMGMAPFLELAEGVRRRQISRLDLRKSGYANLINKIAPIDAVYDLLREINFHKRRLRQENLFSAHIQDISELISERLGDCSILYFPTFRRVEEDLKNLGYTEGQFNISQDDNRLIHFGMNDVQRRFNAITDNISKLSKEGFSQLSSEILSQLISGLPKVDESFIEKFDENDIQIILDRIGTQMGKSDKERITEMIVTREVLTKDKYLLYFLKKLIDIYEDQRVYDNTIKEFVKVCNYYLVNKEIVYDESSLKIYIQSLDTDEELKLNRLSSGEKQIVSILSRIYLNTEDSKYIVLFDEPELSLSIFWQRRLLPDIVNSGKCSALIAVTHSPFIFENELDNSAINLKEYFQKI